MSNIGVYRESSLHASIKKIYALGDFASEVSVDGFIVDLFNFRQIIEVQTGNFSHIRGKIQKLLESYKVLIVYPIAIEKYIVRQSILGKQLSRRKSPARGNKYDIFGELVYIAPLLSNPNLEIEILEIIEEVKWVDDGKGSWRRGKWSILDRTVLEVRQVNRLSKPQDYDFLGFLEKEATVKEIAQHLKIRVRLAQKMVYCLRSLGLLGVVGKRNRSFLYARTKTE
jgi:hypothetical protein